MAARAPTLGAMTEPEDAPTKKKKGTSWLVRLVIAGGSLGTVMGVVLALLFGAYKIPSASMWPTMRLGERVMATRLAKQPFRGALMVFHFPEHRESLFAKRIVGLEGDRVAVLEGAITINGWKIPRCVVGRASYHDEVGGSADKHEGTLSVEWLGQATYLVFEEKTSSGAPGEGSDWKVATGQYFVLGDNRNNSHDSRLWFAGKGGGVPLADTIGRVVGHESVTLPAGAEELGPALAACLAKRPEQTDPPPSAK